MADLVWHAATFVYWGDAVVRIRAGLRDADAPILVEAPADEELIDWFEKGVRQLTSTLTELDPDDTLGASMVERGYPGPSLYRHNARELGVHRWDAENAYGTPTPINDGLAADWLDGVLMTWLRVTARDGKQAQGPWAGESVHFHRTDGDGDWLVRLLGPGAVDVARGPGAADIEVRGRGSDLLLLAMNRIPPTHPRLEVRGDLRFFARWAAEIRYGRPAAGAHWFGSPRPPVASAHHVTYRTEPDS